MARTLIVGGGCRGRELARGLTADGHAVRMTTRQEQGRGPIEAVGAECWVGDPDVVGSLRYAMAGVTILIWALSTASGDPERVAALHDTRLEMMLTNVIDSTVRGLVYEAEGSVDEAVLSAGADRVKRAAERSQIPHEILRASTGDAVAWASVARAAVDRLLAGDGTTPPLTR